MKGWVMINNSTLSKGMVELAGDKSCKENYVIDALCDLFNIARFLSQDSLSLAHTKLTNRHDSFNEVVGSKSSFMIQFEFTYLCNRF